MLNRTLTRFQASSRDRRALGHQFARFIAIGMLNTAVGYLIYAAGVLAGLRPEMALLGAFVFALLFNYLTHARLVFRRTGFAVFMRFVAAYVVIYVINVFALRLMLTLVASSLLAQAIVLPFVVICTFAIFRLAVFRSTNSSPRRGIFPAAE